MAWFVKKLLSNPIRSTAGWIIPFQDIGDDSGLLETPDEYLISELRDFIRRGRGGVIEITHDQVEEYKKKSSSTTRSGQPRYKPLVASPPPHQSQKSESVAEVRTLASTVVVNKPPQLVDPERVLTIPEALRPTPRARGAKVSKVEDAQPSPVDSLFNDVARLKSPRR